MWIDQLFDKLLDKILGLEIPVNEVFEEEEIVRSRLGDATVEKLLEEMDLERDEHQTWIDLERMSVWQ